MFPVTYLPRWLTTRCQARSLAALATVFFLAFTGVRGVRLARRGARHSLDARQRRAFSLPRPDLFVTFGVIILTLIGLGMMLPAMTRWLGLNRLGKKEHRDEIKG